LVHYESGCLVLQAAMGKATIARDMKRRLLYGSLLIVLGLNLVVGCYSYFSSVNAAEKDEAYPNLKLFSVVLDRVRTEYVDGNKLTYQELIHAALMWM